MSHPEKKQKTSPFSPETSEQALLRELLEKNKEQPIMKDGSSRMPPPASRMETAEQAPVRELREGPGKQADSIPENSKNGTPGGSSPAPTLRRIQETSEQALIRSLRGTPGKQDDYVVGNSKSTTPGGSSPSPSLRQQLQTWPKPQPIPDGTVRLPFAGFDNHGSSCFLSAALTIVREAEGVCKMMEQDGVNPYAGTILSAVRWSAAAGTMARTTRVHDLMSGRFPLGKQADAVEALGVAMQLATGGVCPPMQFKFGNAIKCMTSPCVHVTEREELETSLQVIVPSGSKFQDGVSVVRLIENTFVHCEMLTWKCPACEGGKGMSVDKVGELPEYLVVSLVRNNTALIRRTPVRVPRALMIRGKKFNLKVAVYFTGLTPESGHYVCGVFRDGGEWEQNDETVRPWSGDFHREELVVAILLEAEKEHGQGRGGTPK